MYYIVRYYDSRYIVSAPNRATATGRARKQKSSCIIKDNKIHIKIIMYTKLQTNKKREIYV